MLWKHLPSLHRICLTPPRCSTPPPQKLCQTGRPWSASWRSPRRGPPSTLQRAPSTELEPSWKKPRLWLMCHPKWWDSQQMAALHHSLLDPQTIISLQWKKICSHRKDNKWYLCGPQVKFTDLFLYQQKLSPYLSETALTFLPLSQLKDHFINNLIFQKIRGVAACKVHSHPALSLAVTHFMQIDRKTFYSLEKYKFRNLSRFFIIQTKKLWSHFAQGARSPCKRDLKAILNIRQCTPPSPSYTVLASLAELKKWLT